MDPHTYRRIYGLVKEAKPVEADPGATVLSSPGVPARIHWRRLLAGVVGALILVGILVAGAYYLKLFAFYPPRDQTRSASYLRNEIPSVEVDKFSSSPISPKEKAESIVKPEVPIPAKSVPVAEEKKPDLVLGKVLSAKGLPGVILQRREKDQPWKVLPPGSPAISGDQLLCLPGFSGELDLNTGIRLRLQGNLPDDSPFLESEGTLQSSPGVDLDLALFRGRVAIAHHKPQSSVRVRFLDEVWDLELKGPEAEVALELWSVYPPGLPFHKAIPAEEPMAGLNLFVLKGSVKLKIRYDAHNLQGPPGPCFFTWNNIGPQSRQAKSLTKLPLWTTFPPSVPDQARKVLEDLQKRLETKGSIESVFEGPLRDADHFARLLALFELVAVDSLAPLLDVWADQKQPAGIRLSATAALKHWMGRNAGRDLRLYQALEKKHSPETAETLMTLLHGFSAKQAQEPATYQTLIGWLKHELLPVREMAFAELFALVPEGRKIPFDPAGDAAQRERAFQEWKKLIPDGQLPPKSLREKRP
jgi:hypothetical protein